MRSHAARLDRAASRLLGFRRPGFQDRATRIVEFLVEQALHDHDVVLDVVADPLLRIELRALAATAAAVYLPIEVICSDPAELERRLQTRGRRWIRIAGRSAERYNQDPDGLLLDTVQPVTSLVDRIVGFLEQSR
jgi:hypothetical protein